MAALMAEAASGGRKGKGRPRSAPASLTKKSSKTKLVKAKASSSAAPSYTEVMAAFAKKLFAKLDKDTSGSIEIKEMKFFLRKVVGINDKDTCRKVATAMMRLATDDGGAINEQDFVDLLHNIAGAGVGECDVCSKSFGVLSTQRLPVGVCCCLRFASASLRAAVALGKESSQCSPGEVEEAVLTALRDFCAATASSGGNKRSSNEPSKKAAKAAPPVPARDDGDDDLDAFIDDLNKVSNAVFLRCFPLRRAADIAHVIVPILCFLLLVLLACTQRRQATPQQGTKVALRQKKQRKRAQPLRSWCESGPPAKMSWASCRRFRRSCRSGVRK